LEGLMLSQKPLLPGENWAKAELPTKQQWVQLFLRLKKYPLFLSVFQFSTA
jgi:hypothetical protein